MAKKAKVSLKQKKIANGKISLYLEYNMPTRRREFLGMYLYAAPKKSQTNYNNETLETAEKICQMKQNQLDKPEIYTTFEKERLQAEKVGNENFVAYFEKLALKRKESNHDNWQATLKYLKTFTKGEVKFIDVTETFCNDFKEYLLNVKSNKSNKVTLSQNTAQSYFNKFKATLKQAFVDNKFTFDLNSKIKRITSEETSREHLTIEELNRLAQTECNNPLLKTVSLFSALTGLRFSDIQKMVWNEIEYIEGNGYFIKYRQQKTTNPETLPISEQAYSLLGEPEDGNKKIFEGLKYSAHENSHLAKWIGLAGITKHITFHCFRHTYATLQLSEGTDIYTVSKMLGHRELKTTQIYAKIVDETKRKATEKIKIEL
jgi:integrase